jgi:enterochelin esterase-like enzyme
VAAQQKNFQLFTYLDDNAQSWNKRGELDSIRNAVDGSAAFGAHPNWGRESRRHSVRKAIYSDGTTFRTKTIIVYTPTAFSALTVGTSTLSFMVEGEATAVVYTLAKKVAERQPSAQAARNLADHA